MDTNITHLIRQGLSTAVSADAREASPDRLAEVAREFEALFIHQMLSQMREASTWSDDEDSGMFGGQLLETIDVEVARQLAKGGGLGLAEMLMPALREAGVVNAAPDRAPSAPEVQAVPVRPAEIIADAVAPQLRGVTEMTSAFGWRRDPIAGDGRFHGGVDLRAAYGQEVGAAQAGRVVQVGEQGGYGLTVVVEHRPGVETRYAHLSSVLVEVGDAVSARQPIGRAGATGRATGPHLHFEVTHHGEPVDPARTRGGIEGLLKQLRLAAD